jgi:MFS family permease
MISSIPDLLPWVSRDGKLIILTRGLRIFAQGSIAVLLAIYLGKIGFSLVDIGAFFSIGVAGSAVLAFVVSLIAEKIRRKRLLIFFALVAAASGLALIFSTSFPVLVLFVFLGSMTGNAGAGPSGPLFPLEQASLAGAAPAEKRTDLFALYGIAATAGSAIGALAAGLPDFFQRSFGLGELESFKIIFGGYVAILVIASIIYIFLSPAIEVHVSQPRWTNPFKLPSRKLIFTLVGLFCIDRFSGSMVIQSLVAYWFSTRFDIRLSELGFIFFISYVLEAFSIWLAARIAHRFGLLNTMVFTHIPSSLFLIAATFAPVGWLAVLFWQLRSLVGSMDVPTRDSYTMAIVSPEERVAMASIHVVGGSITSTAGPSFSSLLWNTFSAQVPFLLAGIIKIGYDLTLYSVFRNVKPPEEIAKSKDKNTI